MDDECRTPAAVHYNGRIYQHGFPSPLHPRFPWRRKRRAFETLCPSRRAPRAACAISCPRTSGAATTSSASCADVYRRYGFEPLETPALENIETLTGKYGEEGNKLIFKVLRRGEHEASGETDLALRYDLTVPLARVVAEHRGKLPKFFKRYQIQPVWRADRPARGRFREFYQCDVDAIGSTLAGRRGRGVRRGQRRAAEAGVRRLRRSG